MATVLSICGSPSATSRTVRLLRHLETRLTGHGHRVVALDVRDLPAEALLHADTAHPDIARARTLVERADGIVVGTPIYKAAYSGLLKSLLDLLPPDVLAGKTVLPLATGGSTAHTLAVDYALRPVLCAMGASHVVQGCFVLQHHVTVEDTGDVTLEPTTAEALDRAVDRFSTALTADRPLAATR